MLHVTLTPRAKLQSLPNKCERSEPSVKKLCQLQRSLDIRIEISAVQAQAAVLTAPRKDPARERGQPAVLIRPMKPAAAPRALRELQSPLEAMDQHKTTDWDEHRGVPAESLPPLRKETNE